MVIMNASHAVDLAETQQPNLYAAAIVLFSLVLIVVLLRFWCRWINAAGFWIDDWLICVALVRFYIVITDLTSPHLPAVRCLFFFLFLFLLFFF